MFNVSGKCPHCGALTLLETMSEEEYRLSKPALMSILHTLTCTHCACQFGTQARQLVTRPS